MQEGTPAFVTMVKISSAVAAYKQEHLPYITYLRHPTTGGVFASWGSLGHVTVGEPGAMIGFLGARVYEALYGQPFPEDVQTAENLFAHGLLDAVLPVELLTATAARFLDLVLAPHDSTPAPDVPRSHSPTSRPGSRSPARATLTARVCAPCSSSAPPTSCPSSAPAPASGTARCSSPWPASRARPVSSSDRTVAVSRPRRPSGRRGCASPAAG